MAWSGRAAQYRSHGTFRRAVPRAAPPRRPFAWTGSAALHEEQERERGVRRRRILLALSGLMLAVGSITLLTGGFGLIEQTRARPLTPQERERYIREDVALRWRSWPAAMVFPDGVEYAGLEEVQQYARRIGIADAVPCGTAVDARVGAVLDRHGCTAMLRATYVDQSSSFVITVGIAVLQDEQARARLVRELPVDGRSGVLPVAFPGTVASGFGPAQRQRTGWVSAGPYVVFSTAGYADGRRREAVPPEELLHSELWPTAQTVAGRIARQLSEPPEVPRCTQGNVC
ncbi:hypothetical protein [Rhizohabitans arisaemae]|uniref:hypothetical protein n=1 Tax=Rhizohabitans arisaemae TaxID=2720610 RepID=UPI0024B14259|nr:hypothetical protein [Rhizohabitans arisaemae]